MEWVRKWLDLRERLVEIAKTLRRFPWMAEVVKRNPMSVLHPYMVNAYAAKDGSEVCLQLASKTFCARGGEVREVKLELKRARLEPYEGKPREVYRPKGLFAFTAAAKYSKHHPQPFLPNPLTYRLKPCFSLPLSKLAS